MPDDTVFYRNASDPVGVWKMAVLPPGGKTIKSSVGSEITAVRASDSFIKCPPGGTWEATPRPSESADQVPSAYNIFAKPVLSAPVEVVVPADAATVYVPLDLSHTDFSTVRLLKFGLSNGTGINVGSYANHLPWFHRRAHVWSRGDSKRLWVRINIPANLIGDGKTVLFTYKPDGSTQNIQGGQVTIRWSAGAPAQVVTTEYHRPMRRLVLDAAVRANTFNPATEAWADSGVLPDTTPAWRARLSHGYNQAGNGETGLYANLEAFPAAENPISYDATENAIKLHSTGYTTPIVYNSTNYEFQAVMLQGQKKPDVCGASGVWRWVGKMPGRGYAWPAFWLIGMRDDGTSQWPPEIDGEELFQGAYGFTDYPMTGWFTTGAQHYGPAGSNNRLGSHGFSVNLDDWRPELIGTPNFWDGYHSWEIMVTYDDVDTLNSEVILFRDGIEIYSAVLLARHHDMETKLKFYPLMNVAVKTPSGYTPANYNADKVNTDAGRIARSGDMFVRDMGYYPTGATLVADYIPGVVQNNAPLLNTMPGVSSGVGTTASVNLATFASDIEGPVTFTAAGLPAGLSISAAGLITGTLPGTAGSHTVTVTITDTGGLTASGTFTWQVVAQVGTVRQFSQSTGYKTAAVDTTGLTFELDATAAEIVDGGSTAYQVLHIPNVMSFRFARAGSTLQMWNTAGGAYEAIQRPTLPAGKTVDQISKVRIVITLGAGGKVQVWLDDVKWIEQAFVSPASNISVAGQIAILTFSLTVATVGSYAYIGRVRGMKMWDSANSDGSLPVAAPTYIYQPTATPPQPSEWTLIGAVPPLVE